MKKKKRIENKKWLGREREAFESVIDGWMG